MGSFIDITGKKFGRWTVLSRADGRFKEPKWLVRCECGNERAVAGWFIRSGKSKSCGCLNREINAARCTHGRCKTPEYRSWYAARKRCDYPNHRDYGRYGGRGIRFCDHWRKFENFFADMGPKPSQWHSLDRIDNNKGYEPGNCRWATTPQQMVNRHNTHFVFYRDQKMSITEAVKLAGSVISASGAGGRIRRGWNVAEAVETGPVR